MAREFARPQNLLVAPGPINAFTVDVEDYFQVSAFEGAVPREAWETVPSRIDGGLSTVLELLDRAGLHGTFFVLGWVARQRPDLLRTVADRGHEVGCHSVYHETLGDPIFDIPGNPPLLPEEVEQYEALGELLEYLKLGV